MPAWSLCDVFLQKYSSLGGCKDHRIEVRRSQKGMFRKLGLLIVEYAECELEMGLLWHQFYQQGTYALGFYAKKNDRLGKEEVNFLLVGLLGMLEASDCQKSMLRKERVWG